MSTMNTDILSAHIIADLLNKNCMIQVLDTVDSTNTYAKTLECSESPALVIANEQTNGRGRLGRSFYSPSSKGIYMTIAFKPNFDLERILLMTPLAAVAVCKAFEEVAGVNPKIKWVNDIYLQAQKVCGILTEVESNAGSGNIDKIIVGIGINCFEQEFPDDIKDRATFIKNPSKDYDRNTLIASVTNKFFDLLDNFDKTTLMNEYKSRSMLLGQTVLIYGTNHSALPENGGKGIKAKAINIDENGGLVVEYLEGPTKNRTESITSGEVTIRPDLA